MDLEFSDFLNSRLPDPKLKKNDEEDEFGNKEQEEIKEDDSESSMTDDHGD